MHYKNKPWWAFSFYGLKAERKYEPDWGVATAEAHGGRITND